jgi:hypothetical protein
MRRNGERGESLVTVVIAVGILGIMTVVGLRACSNGMSAASSLSLRGDRDQVVSMLSELVSCGNTFDPAVNPSFNPATCDENTLVNIYAVSNGASPRLLVSKSNTSPTTVGKMTLRATCSTDRRSRASSSKPRA